MRNLDLYASKDEECFSPYLGPFCQLIWGLLLTLPKTPGRDGLAAEGLKFLASLAGRR